MIWSSISAQDEFEGNDGIPYRRNWPIDLPPLDEFDALGEPSLHPGDLVTWSRTGITGKNVGLVLMTRWTLGDWLFDKGVTPRIIPEAQVMWNDGETTNTSHPSLRVLSSVLDTPEASAHD